MDDLTQERYGPLSPDDLEQERWPWRGKPATNTPREVARRRRQLWQAMWSPDAGGGGDARGSQAA